VDGKILLEALKQKLHLPAASVKMHYFLAAYVANPLSRLVLESLTSI